MFGSLIDAIRTWAVVWRRRLVMYWRFGEKDNLGFFAMLLLPAVILGFIVYVAYSDDTAARLTAAQKRAVDLRCLAENIYFEARGEPLRGQYAIAEVTMNRLNAPNFPHTICEVVHDTRWDRIRRRLIAHFSWTKIVLKSEEPSGRAWDQAMAVATAVYDNAYLPVVPDALYYHATNVTPYWAEGKQPIAKIGNHVFYR
jgi:spore germination cell wall hydrolase CwlJ-like protein